ncbi:unnamed protein product [Ambrosiozyma monospora]|uniref:Unnamed protein product n=1 Tax=Ambrosiozyma monospora TaxID=43982 RepID=A0A9W6T8S5_AMBMO|nr:unnamed protein product [Ambrosiozyma monospora]
MKTHNNNIATKANEPLMKTEPALTSHANPAPSLDVELLTSELAPDPDPELDFESDESDALEPEPEPELDPEPDP